MKNTFVVQQLAKYDINKGYRRTFLKDEPHIKELRGFVDKIQGEERELTATELLSLARILLGKNNRSEEQLSSQIFKGLADVFGGFEVLDFLDQKRFLTGQNLLFLGRNLTAAVQLAECMVSLSDKIPSYMPQLLNLSWNMAETDCLSSFQFLDTTNLEHPQFYVLIMDCLHQHNVQIDNLLSLLKGIKEIIPYYSVINSLAGSNLDLLTTDNISKLLKLQKPFEFKMVLEVLKVTQTQLDSMFENDCKMSYRAADILLIFKTAVWDINLWWQHILTADDFSLYLAFEKLEKLKISSKYLLPVFPCMFEHPKQASKLVDAVEVLNSHELNEADLKVLVTQIQHPVPVAKAIVALKKEKLFEDANMNLAIAHPEHAFGLSQMIIVFEKIKKFPYLEAHRIIQEHPEHAYMTAKVLQFLHDNNLDQTVNIRAVCGDRQSHSLLLNIMSILKNANLLNQDNLDLLLAQNKYFKTLLSAVNCLDNAKKLNQDNFEELVNDPLNSLFKAEKLEGKLYPHDFKFLADKGAKSFVSIRNLAHVMTKSHNQGLLFFTKPTDAANEAFVKYRGKTIAEAEHEVMVKIAEYCGSGYLEDDTSQHIANTTYSPSNPGK